MPERVRESKKPENQKPGHAKAFICAILGALVVACAFCYYIVSTSDGGWEAAASVVQRATAAAAPAAAAQSAVDQQAAALHEELTDTKISLRSEIGKLATLVHHVEGRLSQLEHSHSLSVAGASKAGKHSQTSGTPAGRSGTAIKHESPSWEESMKDPGMRSDLIVRAAMRGFLRVFNITDVNERELDEFLKSQDVKGNGRAQAARSLMELIFRSSASGRMEGVILQVQHKVASVSEKLKISIDGGGIPYETDPRGCRMLIFLMAAALLGAERGTVAVEYGTMMGYSTRCLAAGAKIAAVAGAPGGFYAFDTFDYMPTHKPAWKTSGVFGKEEWLKEGDNYMHQVQRHVLPFSVTLIKGFLGTAPRKGEDKMGTSKYWNHRPVSAVAVDGGKDRAFFNAVMPMISPALPVGSIVILGDSLAKGATICIQLGIVVGALMRPGILELIHVADSTTHTIWEVKKPIPVHSVDHFQYHALTHEEWDSAWDQYEKQMHKLMGKHYGQDIQLEEGRTQRFQHARQCTKNDGRWDW